MFSRPPARAERPAAGDRLSLTAGPALAVSAIGAGLALVGFAAVGPPLAVPGAGLLVLGLLSVVLTWLVAARVHVHGEARDETVSEGDAVQLEIDIASHRLLGLVGASLEHPLLAEPYALSGPAAAGAGRISRFLGRGPRRLAVTGQAHRRGALMIPSPRITFSDALGLVHAERHDATPIGSLLVLPRIEPVRWFDRAVAELTTVTRAAPAGTEATDLSGLREYRPGTPATRIHWPSLARGGDLLERFYESETEFAPLVVLDARCADATEDGPRLDAVVRAVASLTLDLAARSGVVEMLLPGNRVPLRITGHTRVWSAAHQFLARLDAEPPGAAAPALPEARGGVLVYGTVYPSVASAATRGWSGAVLTVSPHRPGSGGARAVAEVAGCGVHRIEPA